MTKITVQTLQSNLCDEWKKVLYSEMGKSYWNDIVSALNKDSKTFLPKLSEIFNAFNYCHPDKVKAVIVGQDPYPNRNNAHGFSFSVKEGVRVPASLRTIYDELMAEYGMKTNLTSGCLMSWEKEGVLLLNSVLTVREGSSDSHKDIGWQEFTSAVIKYLDRQKDVVFLAWGAKAIRICSDNVENSTVITAGHPSPMNRTNPFYGCGCFRKCNEILRERHILPIRWIVLWYKK